MGLGFRGWWIFGVRELEVYWLRVWGERVYEIYGVWIGIKRGLGFGTDFEFRVQDVGF